MALIYRGQTANRSTLANTAETNRLGQFRGAHFNFRAPQTPSRNLSELSQRQYRGALY